MAEYWFNRSNLRMSNIPSDLKYSRSHEWLRQLADGNVEVGISDHAQQALGDLVFVELPEVGRTLEAQEACAVVESVKAASDLYSPIPGSVVAVNERLVKEPELINQDPYGRGWIMRLKPATAGSTPELLSASDYKTLADEA
jgi:glycine cleavage system H protein